MKFKKYSKGNDIHIKELVDFYAKEVGSGVCLVLKNRNGLHDYGSFISPEQLTIELNAADKVALESDNGVNVYCHYQEHFDTLVNSIDEYEKRMNYSKDSDLDGMI